MVQPLCLIVDLDELGQVKESIASKDSLITKLREENGNLLETQNILETWHNGQYHMPGSDGEPRKKRKAVLAPEKSYDESGKDAREME